MSACLISIIIYIVTKDDTSGIEQKSERYAGFIVYRLATLIASYLNTIRGNTSQQTLEADAFIPHMRALLIASML